MGDEAARREQQRRFAEARQAERGDYEPERGDYEPERGDYEPERGASPGLGRFEGASNANHVAADIFRKAAALGGHLVVAFVAPIGASSSMSARRLRRRSSSSVSEGAAARAHVAALIEQLMQARTKARQQGPVTSKTSTNDGVAGQTSAFSATQQPAQTSPRRD